MKVNEMYVAPALEVINVMVEAGFAGSDPENNTNTDGGSAGMGGWD